MKFFDHPEKGDNSQSAPSMHKAKAPPQTLEEAYALIKEMKGRAGSSVRGLFPDAVGEEPPGERGTPCHEAQP